jgi:hypothetical protein
MAGTLDNTDSQQVRLSITVTENIGTDSGVQALSTVID